MFCLKKNIQTKFCCDIHLLATYAEVLFHNEWDRNFLTQRHPLPPTDSTWAMIIVWRLWEKIIRTVLCCIVHNSCAQWFTCMWTVLKFAVSLGLDFVFVCLFRFGILCVFYVTLDHFICVLLAFVVLCLVTSVLSQEIGWEERPRHNLLECKKTQSIDQRHISCQNRTTSCFDYR